MTYVVVINEWTKPLHINSTIKATCHFWHFHSETYSSPQAHPWHLLPPGCDLPTCSLSITVEGHTVVAPWSVKCLGVVQDILTFTDHFAAKAQSSLHVPIRKILHSLHPYCTRLLYSSLHLRVVNHSVHMTTWKHPSLCPLSNDGTFYLC